jgi:putative copper export protein
MKWIGFLLDAGIHFLGVAAFFALMLSGLFLTPAEERRHRREIFFVVVVLALALITVLIWKPWSPQP